MKGTQKSGKSRLSNSSSLSQLENLKGSKKATRNDNAKVSKEKQGPTDWSVRGLKSKYRGEAEREAAYNLWVSASYYAQKTQTVDDLIIPTVRIERHPFYVSYYSHLNNENNMSSARTKARLLQKRFVFDVQEVWLTNMEHLRELDPKHMYNDAPADEKAAKLLANEAEDFNRGNGLQTRRDVRAIQALDSQIQSVSQKRAFANAYHTSRLPNIQVVLDYEPRPTPELHDIKCLPPSVESLVRGLRIAPSAGTDPTDDFPILHSTASYPDLVYVLHIDRLLPSADYLHVGAMEEVMWRFSLYRNDDSSAAQLYLCPESSVTQYCAQLIMSKSEQQASDQNNAPGSIYLLCSGLVYADSEQPVHLPCIELGAQSEGGAQMATVSSREAVVVISVAVLAMARQHRREAGASGEEECFDCVLQPDLLAQRRGDIYSIKLEICATLLGTTTEGRGLSAMKSGEVKVFLECSPSELRHMLRSSPAASEAPLGGGAGIDWWIDQQRTRDLWPLLAEHLVLECYPGAREETGYGLAFASTVEQRQERSSQGSGVSRVYAEQVAGALSTMEALACCFELQDAIRLIQQPRIPLDHTSVTAEGDDTLIRTHPPPTSTSLHTLYLEKSPSTFFTHVEMHKLADKDSKTATAVPSPDLPVSVTPNPPATPLLYFNDHQSVPSRGPTGQKTATPASRGKETDGRTESSHSHDPGAGKKGQGKGRNARKFDRIMAPLAETTLVHLQRGYWEQVQDTGSNLSMIVSGSLPTMLQVPGAFEHGRKGIWFPDQNTAPVEYTQAAARFFRETRPTSNKSVLVNMTFALDTSLLFDPVLAWEAFSSFPAPSPAEEVDGVVPVLTVPPRTLLGEALVSPLETRLSETVMVFTSLPVEGVDFIPLDTPTLPRGFRRNVPIKNRYGYREQIEVTLLGVDPVLATVVFGITRTGAVPNNLGVNNRNLWHNTLAITEHINRPRAPKDYHYILVRSEHCGSNEPTRYTTRMRGDKMVGLTSSAISEFEENYAAIQQLRDIFNKQVALDAKIEKVENEIIIKQKLQKIFLQNQLQRALEKKMRKATKSELGWRSRFKMSTLVEVQGNWERRRDDRTGMFFFRNLYSAQELRGQQAYMAHQQGSELPEQFMQSCQWEVPPHWDGDPLSTEIGGGKEQARLLYPNQTGTTNYNKRRAGVDGGASFGSLSAADQLSELQEEELDPFDLAPARWDPHPPQHRQQQAVASLKLPAKTGAFDQPPDSWMPQTTNMRGGNSSLAGGGSTVDGRMMHMQNNNNNNNKNQTQNRRQQPAMSHRSETDSLNSAMADRSVAESAAATIDTANLEHIAEQLVSSDELMRVIARRLGIPESQVVPADDLSSVFSVSTAGDRSKGSFGAHSQDDRQNPLHAPRDPWVDTLDEPAFDSDDDLWSDEEDEVGDFDEEKEIGLPEDMPQTQLEAAQLRRRELREIRGNRTEVVSVPDHIPALDLRHLKKPLQAGETDLAGEVQDELKAREELFGWRRLPRPVIRPGFLADALLTHTKPPDATSSNTLNAPVFLMPISPVDACKYYPEEFTTAIESIFVPDAKKDMERSIATVERNIRREEELTRNLPTDDLLLFGEATGFTSADAFLARQRKQDLDQVRDPSEEAREKAILAAKSSNIAMMEDSLAMDADPNTTDEFGNTLLILAAQQGSKRMCKFLLRKGANINKQSIVGNTPLHYCYAYSNIALGEYLKAKGADDSIVNVDKLTCYEGLSMDSMKEFYGDDDEAHMLMDAPPPDSDQDD